MITDTLTYSNKLWSGFERRRNIPEAYNLLLLFGERETVNQPVVISALYE